jgi:hypothetical protein
MKDIHTLIFKVIAEAIMKVELLKDGKAYTVVGRYKVPPSAYTLKVEAASNCEMLVPVYQYTRCHTRRKIS